METNIQRIHAQYRKIVNRIDDDDLKKRRKDEFPEILPDLQSIADDVNMESVPIPSPSLRRLFPAIPGGYITLQQLATNEYQRFGVCSAFRDEEITLAVHAYRKSKRVDTVYWRAVVLRHNDGKLIMMNKVGRSGKPTWHENFYYFLGDINGMINLARQKH